MSWIHPEFAGDSKCIFFALIGLSWTSEVWAQPNVGPSSAPPSEVQEPLSLPPERDVGDVEANDEEQANAGGMIWFEDPEPELLDDGADESHTPLLEENAEDTMSPSLFLESERPDIFRGMVRLTGALWHDRTELANDEGMFNSVARGIVEHEWKSGYHVEVNAFLQFGRIPAGALTGAFANAGGRVSPYRTKYLRYAFWDDNGVSGVAGIDRLALRWHDGPWTARLGRFPINFSVTQVFTPNDFFAPFAATSINQIYKPGIDAMSLGRSLGQLGSFELVAGLGYDDQSGAPSPGQSVAIARIAGVWKNFEWAALGGRVARRWIAGASLQGDIKGVGLRAEGHVGRPDTYKNVEDSWRKKPYGRVAAGLDYTFDWQMLTVGAEYYFDSSGAQKPTRYLDRTLTWFPDDIPYLARHYAGGSASMEIIPIVRASAIALYNANDQSGLAGAFFFYDAAERAELMAGFYLPWGQVPTASSLLAGDLRSEFGGVPWTLFFESRTYF